MSTSIPKPPEILDKIVDLVLAHKPKPESKAAAKRKKWRKINTRHNYLFKSSYSAE